jgi:hypothetical protein
MNRKVKAHLLLLPYVLSMASCEPGIKAKVECGNPPAFVISSGTGRFWHISVVEYVPDKSLKPSERSRELWRVDAKGRELARYSGEIGKVTYGVVPQGYKQIVPASGGSPPPLVHGKYYSYYITSENGMPATGDFEIRDGVAVVTKIDRGCTEFRGGEELDVPCPNSNGNVSR